jgi:DNA-binding XRE family transcriptional regulator
MEMDPEVRVFKARAVKGNPKTLGLGIKSTHVQGRPTENPLAACARVGYSHAVTPTDMGPRIKRLRKQRGLTQAELAEKVGVQRVYIARIESQDTASHYRRPSLATLERLAKALKTSVGQLLGERRAKRSK